MGLIFEGEPFAIFAGAGISVIKPTSLPNWRDYNICLLESLHREASKRGSVWDSLLARARDALADGDAEGKYGIPGDFFSQVLSARMGASYFDALVALDADNPNAVHLWIARLAGTGQVRHVVTTNFDTLIEQAFEQLGVPHRILQQREDFEAYLENPDGDACVVMKVHGSVTQPHGRLVDTLAQRLVGLPEAIGESIRHVLDAEPMLVIGSSGRDLRVAEDYFHFERGDIEGRRIRWLFQNRDRVSADVSALFGRYAAGGACGEEVFGSLPDALDALPGDFPLSQPVETVLGGASTKRDYQRVLSDWAARIGPVRCAALLCDLSDHIGDYSLAIDAIRALIPEDEFASIGDLGPLALEIGELLARRGGDPDRPAALAYLQQARSAQLGVDEQRRTGLALAVILAANYRFDEALSALGSTAGSTSEPRDELDVRLCVETSGLLYRLGRWDDAERWLCHTIVKARQLGFPLLSGRAQADLALLYKGRHAFRNAFMALNGAVMDLGKTGATAELAQARIFRGYLKGLVGHAEEARVDLEAALDMAKSLGDRSVCAQAYARLAVVLSQLGDEVGSKEMASAAGREAKSVRNRLLGNIALNAHFGGWPDPVRVGDDPMKRIGELMHFIERSTLSNRRDECILWAAGAHAAAMDLEDEPARKGQTVSYTSRTLGLQLMQTGNTHSALRIFNRAEAEYFAHHGRDEHDVRITLAANRADALMHAGRYQTAEKEYRTVFDAEKEKDEGGLAMQTARLAMTCAYFEGALHRALDWRGKIVDIVAAHERDRGTKPELTRMIEKTRYASDWAQVDIQIAAGDRSAAYKAVAAMEGDLFGLDSPFVTGLKRAEIWLEHARLASAMGHEAAQAYLNFIFGTVEPDPLIGATDQLLAQAHLLQASIVPAEQPLRAEQHLREAARQFQKGPDPFHRTFALIALAVRFGCQGRLGEADKAIAQAGLELRAIESTLANDLFEAVAVLRDAGWPSQPEAEFAIVTALGAERALNRVFRHFAHRLIYRGCSVGEPRLKGMLEGPDRTVRVFCMGIEHAVFRSDGAYDGILVFGRPAQWLGDQHDRLWRVRKPGRLVETHLAELDRKAACKGWSRVASMPIGRGSNAALRDWVGRPGLPRALDFYVTDPFDFGDIFSNEASC